MPSRHWQLPSWGTVHAHLWKAWDPRATLRTLIPPGLRRPAVPTKQEGGRPHRAPARFAALDGARALALLWVLALHTQSQCQDGGESLPVTAQWRSSWATQPWINGDAGLWVAEAASARQQGRAGGRPGPVSG